VNGYWGCNSVSKANQIWATFPSTSLLNLFDSSEMLLITQASVMKKEIGQYYRKHHVKLFNLLARTKVCRRKT
jgi:hypothetical protein